VCNIYSLLSNDLKNLKACAKYIFGRRICVLLLCAMFVQNIVCTNKYLASYNWGVHRDVGTHSRKVVMTNVGSKWKLVRLEEYHIWSKLFYPFKRVVPRVQTDGLKDLNGHSVGIETCLKLMTKVEKFWTDYSCWVLNLVHTSLKLCCLCRPAEVWSICRRGEKEDGRGG